MAALISLADVKALYLNIGVGDTSKDAAITQWILWASDAVEQYCNQPILQTTYTAERFDGTGTDRWIFPHTLPISGVDDLQHLSSFGGTWEDVDTDMYEVLTIRGATTLYMPSGFTQGAQNYRITYVAGYALANVPAAVRRVCCEMVARIFAETVMGSGELGRDMAIGNMDGIGSSTIRIKDLKPELRQALRKYRLPVV